MDALTNSNNYYFEEKYFHDNRRKEVENYAKTKKCPHYDRVVMLKDEENNILKDRLECSQKENFDLLEDFENMRNRYFLF